MTPWNELTAEQFAEKVSFKLKQIGSDLMLLKNAESGIRKVIWFGTEPLPKELAEALAKANIPYWIIKP